ncbi:MAG: GntR family transcriptional regulator [Oscillospiraceae bacterium]
MFMLDLKSRVPIYEQLKSKTLELIMAGVLATDDKMPSVRTLARDLGVNPNTIQKAYQDMEKDGIIYSVTGKGSFVAAKPQDNDVAVNAAAEKLFKAVYEARLYGVERETAMEVVNKAYEKE